MTNSIDLDKLEKARKLMDKQIVPIDGRIVWDSYSNCFHRYTRPCGGCGETDSNKRCLGCRHEF